MVDLLVIGESLSLLLSNFIAKGIGFETVDSKTIDYKDFKDKVYKIVLIDLDSVKTSCVTITRIFIESKIMFFYKEINTYKLFICKELGVDVNSFDILDKDFILNLLENSKSDKIKFNYSKKNYLIDSSFLEASLNPESLEVSIKSIFYSLSLISKNDIIVLILNIGRETSLFAQFTDRIRRNNYDTFLKFCFHNHYDSIPGDNPTSAKQIFINNHDNSSFDELVLNNREISSYLSSPLNNEVGDVIGTIHLGNFTNNYFNNDKIRGHLLEMFYIVGAILGKNIKFRNAIDEKKDIRSIFSKFVPEKIIDKHLREGKIEKGGELKRVAILFTDIRSFTTISEKNSADAVVSFLNNYFNIMVKCIREEGGVIDKFIGDAVVAIFGAPDDLINPGQNAINAAIAMIKNLKNVDTDDLILPDGGFAIGIGLHIGNSIVGNIGSNDKISYTSIGDVITVAEELEALTKHYKKRILFTKDIALDIDNKPIYIDTITLEGEGIEIYTV